jgi:hypothetical protein
MQHIVSVRMKHCLNSNFQPQEAMLRPRSFRFIGLIIPGGWEEFFRFVGEPYSGPLFPTNDKRNSFEVLIPKLMAATEKFDMIPVRDKAQFDPQPWDGSETKLPGVC